MTDEALPSVADDPGPAPRWGRRDERTLVGGAAIVAGTLLIVQMSGATLWAGLLGGVLHITGWLILPERGPRRISAALLSTVAVLMMLLGPPLAWTASVPLALWLLVRRSPPIAYLLAPVPGLWALVLVAVAGSGASRLLLFGSTFAVACATAWLAGRIAVRERAESEPDLPADS